MQALIDFKKCQSVKCVAEYAVLKHFVIKQKSKCESLTESINTCKGEDKGKEIELCEEIVRTKGILKYFQSKLASCEEVSKKVTSELDELCSIQAQMEQGQEEMP